MEKARKRIEYIDILKGFAIITVVFLHVHSGYDVEGTPAGYLIRYFRSFQMSTFFVLSGILYNPNINNYKDKIVGKIKTLFLPSVLWGGIIGIGLESVRKYLGTEGIENYNLKSEIVDFVLGKSSYYGSWFVFTLFGVYLLEYLISFICKKTNFPYKSILITIIHILFAVCGLLIGKYDFSLYYNLRFVLVASMLFYAGYLYQQFNKRHYTAIDILSVIVGIVLSMVNTGVVVFSDFYFANPVISVLAAFCSIYGLIGIAEKLSEKFNFRFLKLMGQNSIIVLYTHFILILVVIRMLEKLLKLPIHTFPAILSFIIIIALEFILVKFMPSCLKKLFGINK
ncbi:acyltransferase family protein [uncultured Eubacterium sp.]|uniref:acyltransferase family protein n=1 Tax=uncultured Eubacterium sp. TaxID=165185 RepID=UPI0025894195|nr:acyltransferase [uncultured Eubacterium sp.]